MGFWVGFFEGRKVGILVGRLVGLFVGAFVGLFVGAFVGFFVGLFVGLLAGPSPANVTRKVNMPDPSGFSRKSSITVPVTWMTTSERSISNRERLCINNQRDCFSNGMPPIYE